MRATKTPTGVRREQIAEAALALLGDRRGRQPSIAGIAKRVGLVPSAVYRHYRGKEAILDAALERVEGKLRENLALARQDAGDPLTRIRGLFLRHAEMLAANPGGPHVVLTHGVFDRSRSRRQKVGRVMTGYLGEVARIVSEGQAEGSIRADIEPQTASLVFIGMLLPAVIFRQVTEGAFDVAEHARKVWPALASALAPGLAGAAAAAAPAPHGVRSRARKPVPQG
jgi:AcrR family transcriptional regulator